MTVKGRSDLWWPGVVNVWKGCRTILCTFSVAIVSNVAGSWKGRTSASSIPLLWMEIYSSWQALWKGLESCHGAPSSISSILSGLCLGWIRACYSVWFFWKSQKLARIPPRSRRKTRPSWLIDYFIEHSEPSLIGSAMRLKITSQSDVAVARSAGLCDTMLSTMLAHCDAPLRNLYLDLHLVFHLV